MANGIIPSRLPLKGSFLRPDENGGFRPQVYAPMPVATSLTAGASATVTLSVQELVALDRLVFAARNSTSGADELHNLVVSNIQIGTDTLAASTAASHGMPGTAFGANAISPIRFGHRVDKTVDCSVTLYNAGPNTITVSGGFATL